MERYLFLFIIFSFNYIKAVSTLSNSTVSECFFYSTTSNEYFDLTPIRLPSTEFREAVFIVPSTQQTYKVYFNLCNRVDKCSLLSGKPYSETQYQSCQQWVDGSIYETGSFNLQFDVSFTSTGLALKYQSRSEAGYCTKRYNEIVLACGNEEFTITGTSESVLCTYSIYVSTKHACGKQGLFYNKNTFYDLRALKRNAQEFPYRADFSNFSPSFSIYFNFFDKTTFCNKIGQASLFYQSCKYTPAGKLLTLTGDSTKSGLVEFSSTDSSNKVGMTNTIKIKYVSSKKSLPSCPSNDSFSTTLICDPKSEYQIVPEYTQPTSTCQYSASIYTKYACPSLQFYNGPLYYDLSPLSLTANEYYTVLGNGGAIYFNLGNRANVCDKYLVSNENFVACQLYNGVYYKIGNLDMGTTIVFSSYNSLTLKYFYSPRTLSLIFKCDSSTDFNIISYSEPQTNQYNIVINSKYACSSTIYFNQNTNQYIDLTPLKLSPSECRSTKILDQYIMYNIGDVCSVCTTSSDDPGYQSCILANPVTQIGGLNNQIITFKANGLTIDYPSGGTPNKINQLILICDPSLEFLEESASQSPLNTYKITIKSKYACPLFNLNFN